MRLLAISRPLTYKRIHEQLRHKSIVIIWIISIISQLLRVITQIFTTETFYPIYRDICLYFFNALPLLSIVVMHVTMVLISKRRKRTAAQTSPQTNAQCTMDEAQNRKMRLIVMRIVLFLLILYVPRLIWWQYYNIVSLEKRCWPPTPAEVIILFINYSK